MSNLLTFVVFSRTKKAENSRLFGRILTLIGLATIVICIYNHGKFDFIVEICFLKAGSFSVHSAIKNQ